MSEPNGYTRDPKKDKRGLTPQQSVFADNVPVVGKEVAAEIAYPDTTETSKKIIRNRNMRNPLVAKAISKIADEHGLTRSKCVETICDGLSATKLAGKDAIEYDDHASRLRAAELGLKLHGELREDRTILPIPVNKEQYIELCKTFWGTKPT